MKRLEVQDLRPSEELELEAWLDQGDNRDFYEKSITRETLYRWLKERMEMDEKRMDKRFFELFGSPAPVRPIFFRWKWIAAAACVLVFLAGGFLIFHRQSRVSSEISQQQVTQAPVVHPGKDRAHLQLANGSVIELDSARDGSIASQGSTEIVKNGSTISYSSSKAPALADAFNILQTPRAGQYSMVLPDGTKVWLNNSSGLKYPVAFSGSQRRVELLNGEAFFEVAPSARKPFTVFLPGGNNIEVLGTSFNVSCYSDELTQKTTLVEGKVRVAAGSGGNLILVPGQQAEESDGRLAINHPDVYSVTAWRRGFFNFSDADVRTVMRQIARWYDVSVEYQGEPSVEKLEGSISRNQNLAETLASLEALHIHTSLKDRTVIVHQ
ncbi:FecR family protein [Puia sp. P3]|uniref:FecR family protein n=1 Tax=Puia sp. P3 TaxID=3423952 RepID=UPI003D66922D